MRFSITNRSEIPVQVDGIYIVKSALESNPFLMSDDSTVVERRIDLGAATLESGATVVQLQDQDLIYRISEERTAYFKVSLNITPGENEINPKLAKANIDWENSSPGDVYMLAKYIDPRSGTEEKSKCLIGNLYHGTGLFKGKVISDSLLRVPGQW